MGNNVSLLIKQKLKITLAEFCKIHLKTQYRTFQYRMRKESYYPAEVVYICWLLNDKCENIFGKSFTDLVLLHDGPGETVPYIKEKLAKADQVERMRLMDLIGMSLPLSYPAASATHNPGKIEVTLEKSAPANGSHIGPVINIKNAPEEFPDDDEGYVSEEEEEEKKEDQPAETDLGFDIIDIDLTGGVAGR